MFERVFTVTDFYDCPRGGIASFRRRPHAYSCLFDSAMDEYADVYELREIDAETLALALEDWAIWRRWRSAFDEGRTSLDTHPALDEDRARHETIAPLFAQRLAAHRGPVTRARGDFRLREASAHDLEVEWTLELTAES